MSRAGAADGAPIIVVGTGVAGLATALAAAPAPVTLVCRTDDGAGSASALAQGGIAAALAAGDEPRAHAFDTLAAGAHHGSAAAVDWLCAQAPATIAWLDALGVAFDRDDAGNLALGREGGHRAARIVHAGGDATGAELVRALQARVRRAAHVRWCGGFDVDALRVRDGRIDGVRVRSPDGASRTLDAAAVVLATGGLGALFARTSNPVGADGAGLELAAVAGARLCDLEFVQFHPTALDVDGHCLPLLTEALRGAGAVLRDRRGAMLMAGVHPLADLAPRDVVARRVFRARHDGAVHLDARAIGGDWARRFPTAFAVCRAHGFDPRRDPLPVTPAAHYHMGGIAVDADGATSRPGLFAVGEVACTGMHGANRLASNSLLEAIACGRRLGARLSRAAGAAPYAAASTSRRVASSGAVVQWHELGPPVEAPRLARLRDMLWTAAGPERDAPTLRHALAEYAAANGWQARLGGRLLRAALHRDRSLGAHHRRDDTGTMRRRMADGT